jgi:hypothetical protein
MFTGAIRLHGSPLGAVVQDEVRVGDRVVAGVDDREGPGLGGRQHRVDGDAERVVSALRGDPGRGRLRRQGIGARGEGDRLEGWTRRGR